MPVSLPHDLRPRGFLTGPPLSQDGAKYGATTGQYALPPMVVADTIYEHHQLGYAVGHTSRCCAMASAPNAALLMRGTYCAGVYGRTNSEERF